MVPIEFEINDLEGEDGRGEELEGDATVESMGGQTATPGGDGAVDHVLATDDLPSTAEICELTGARVGKSFVVANGQPMQTFGECTLECEDSSGVLSAASFAVIEVSRPLQSVSRICDQDLEVLFTKTEAKIRDPRTGRFVATYPRRGGLYTRTVRVRAGKKPEGSGRAKVPFTRQSPKR